MWTPGAGGCGNGNEMSFDDRPVGKPPQMGGGGGGFGGGGGGGGFGGGGGGGGFGGGMSTASMSTSGGTGLKMKKLTVADNFYKRMQEAPGHKVAKKKSAAAAKPGGMPRRPNFLTCYLCGQQFGKSSLPIHQPQCYYKKLIEWERGDASRRGPKPLHPDEMAERAPQASACAVGGQMSERQVEDFNDAQFQHFNDNMVKCENCGRTFFPDRLAVHQRSCKPGASGRGSKPVKGKTVAVPPAHQDPYGARGGVGGADGAYGEGDDDEDFNDCEDDDGGVLMSDYRGAGKPSPRAVSPVRAAVRRSASPKIAPAAGLEPCPQCGRRFVAKKIEAHLAVCKGPSPSGASGAPRVGPGGNPLPTYEESLVPCQYCARTFAPDRVGKHESVCKGSAPPKKKSQAVPPPRKVAAAKPTMMDTDDADPLDSTLPLATESVTSASSPKPKFCQECGHRFSANVPKFCQDCGVRVGA